MLQKSIEHYVRDSGLRLRLIQAVIDCLHEVPDGKVQEKWGHQLLRGYLQADDVDKVCEQHADARDAALRSLKEKMNSIEENGKGSSGNHQRRRQPAAKQGNSRA